MLSAASRVLVIAVTAAIAAGCALHRPDIHDLQREPWRYHDRDVEIDGVVTNSWGAPLVPVRFYRVSDGTGELVVLAQGGRPPARGAKVVVRGQLSELAVLGGSSVGLHLREEKLRVRR